MPGIVKEGNRDGDLDKEIRSILPVNVESDSGKTLKRGFLGIKPGDDGKEKIIVKEKPGQNYDPLVIGYVVEKGKNHGEYKIEYTDSHAGRIPSDRMLGRGDRLKVIDTNAHVLIDLGGEKLTLEGVVVSLQKGDIGGPNIFIGPDLPNLNVSLNEAG